MRSQQIGPSDRKFGYFFSVLMLLVGWFFYGDGQGVLVHVPFGLALFFFASASIYPSILAPLNASWMKLGYVLARIVNPIVMGIIFFGIITPLAVIVRTFGRDELRLKPQSGPSHWKAKDPDDGQASSFKDQF
ncbi:MAG: hypothetical protein AAF468_14775 [Pseudomonadota bacterium]